MKMYLTHNTEIKTFNDTVHHLELKKDRMESSRPEIEAYMADIGHKRTRVLRVSSRVGRVRERVMHLRNKKPINREKYL